MQVHGIETGIGARKGRKDCFFKHIIVSQDTFSFFQEFLRPRNPLLFVHHLHLRDDVAHLHIVVETKFFYLLLHFAGRLACGYLSGLRMQRCSTRQLEEKQ